MLERVHLNGELTRAELTAQLGLNRSTIGALVTDLTDLGVLAEHVPVGPEVAAGPDGSDAELSDAGMSTVEYAVGTVVAAAFAAVLYKIVTGDSVVAGLTGLVNSALHTSL